ncbi:MAG: hypothetical protein HFG34_05610 [Eubacterium sp.]|nr:hypothetical protein [Eubacterium sp.]
MEKKDKFCNCIYVVIAALAFGGMLAYSGVQEFWYDEVYQLGLVGPDKGIGEVFRSYMQLKDYTPPLYAVIVWIWRAVVPFSFPWLLLVSEGFTAAGIFFTALAGRELGGKKLGLLAEILSASSAVLILYAGYEFRSYSLYFLSAALLACALAKRIRSSGKKGYILLTISLLLLLYSHYYGCVIAGVLFLFEMVLVIARKQSFKKIYPYFAAGAGFAPWLLLVFINHTRSITEFWIQPPDLRSLFDLLRFLCSENKFQLWTLCLGIAGCLVCFLAKCRFGRFSFENDAEKLYLPGLVVAVPAVIYFYSTVVNPSGGIFYNRYFIGLLPFCYLLMAQAVLWGWQLAAGRERNREFTALCVGIALVLAVQNGTLLLEELYKEQEISYRGSISILAKKDDITDEGVAVVMTDNSYVRAGIEMYFEGFYRVVPEVISQHDNNFQEIVKNYKKVYLFIGKQPVEDETRTLLSEYKMISRNKKNRIREYVLEQVEDE